MILLLWCFHLIRCLVLFVWAVAMGNGNGNANLIIGICFLPHHGLYEVQKKHYHRIGTRLGMVKLNSALLWIVFRPLSLKWPTIKLDNTHGMVLALGLHIRGAHCTPQTSDRMMSWGVTPVIHLWLPANFILVKEWVTQLVQDIKLKKSDSSGIILMYFEIMHALLWGSEKSDGWHWWGSTVWIQW